MTDVRSVGVPRTSRRRAAVTVAVWLLPVGVLAGGLWAWLVPAAARCGGADPQRSSVYTTTWATNPITSSSQHS